MPRLKTLMLISCLFLPAACDKPAPSPSPAPPQAGGARTTAPATPRFSEDEIAALIRAGGANWSAFEDAEFAGMAIKPGSDYWVWPAEDVAVPRTPRSGGTLTVRLHWQLRAGGKPATGGTVYGRIIGGTPEARVGLGAPAANFDERAVNGAVTLEFAPWKSTEGGEIVLFLTRPGNPAPMSNVLRLKVAAGQ